MDVGICLLPPQGADGAGVQDAGHADGQDGAGLPARHRPLQPRYCLPTASPAVRPGRQPTGGTKGPGLSPPPHRSLALRRRRPAPSPSLGVSLTLRAQPCHLLPKALVKVGRGLCSRAHPLWFGEASGRAFGRCVQREAPLAPASWAPEETASLRASAAEVLEPGCFGGGRGHRGQVWGC